VKAAEFFGLRTRELEEIVESQERERRT